MPVTESRTLSFVSFSLDLARCSLRRGLEDIPLRPKAFDALRYLAENAGRLVSKDEIIKAVWPNVFVTDDSLVQCIKDCREALGDADHRIIKTVPRRGYLFAPKVSAGDPAAPTRPDAAVLSRLPPADRNWIFGRAGRWLPVAAVLIILVVAVGQLLVATSKAPDPELSPASSSQRRSVALLPLLSLSEPPQGDYFADGLTEDIISALGRFPELSVRSRNAVFPYKGKNPRPTEVGRELGVRYVIEGSVRRSVERVRVSVRLTDASGGAVLWSQQYDVEPKDIFAMQDDITRHVAGALAIRLSNLELARVKTIPPTHLEAHDLVLRARELFSRVTRTANSAARSLFEAALALDPDYIPAHTGLGLVDVNAVAHGWTAHPLEALQRAETHGQRAVDLNESHAGPHALLGRIYIRRGEYDRALEAIRRALVLNPSDADTYAALGNALLWTGEIEAAIEAMETAVQFQPTWPVTDYFHLATAYFLAGRTLDAIRILERSLVRFGNVPYTNAMLAAAYAEAGREGDSIRQAERVRRLSPHFVSATFGSQLRKREHQDAIVSALRKTGL